MTVAKKGDYMRSGRCQEDSAGVEGEDIRVMQALYERELQERQGLIQKNTRQRGT